MTITFINIIGMSIENRVEKEFDDVPSLSQVVKSLDHNLSVYFKGVGARVVRISRVILGFIATVSKI